MCEVGAVTKIAKCLQVPLGKVHLNEEQVVTRTFNNRSVTGFATILSSLAKESKTNIAINSYQTREVEAQVYQWIEFAVLYVAPGSKDKHIAQQLLRDFNKLFLKQSYLVGHFLTLADLAVFYAIFDLVIRFFILQLMADTRSNYVCGLPALDMHFITSLLVAISTLFIFLVQYDITHEALTNTQILEN